MKFFRMSVSMQRFCKKSDRYCRYSRILGIIIISIRKTRGLVTDTLKMEYKFIFEKHQVTEILNVSIKLSKVPVPHVVSMKRQAPMINTAFHACVTSSPGTNWCPGR